MRIEELSIGDWVRDSNGIIAKVRGIENWDDGYILNVQTVSGSICALSATGALPIPLTPEILEKNGVTLAEDYDENGGLFTCPEFSVVRYGDGYTFEVPQARVRVEHVHELQHAMRLSGIEKEIEV